MEVLEITEKRHSQEETDKLKSLELVDLLGHNGYGLSKADIVLIYSLYNDLREFYNIYMKSVQYAINNNYKYSYKPHWFLKKILG